MCTLIIKVSIDAEIIVNFKNHGSINNGHFNDCGMEVGYEKNSIADA